MDTEGQIIQAGQARLQAVRHRNLTTHSPVRSVRGDDIQFPSGVCEFCQKKLEPMTSFQDFVFYQQCQCAEVVAVREREKQAEVNQHQIREALRQQKLAQSIRAMFGEMPERFRDRTFQNYRKLPENSAAYETARKYSAQFPQSTGLMFFGDVGTGKTHLAAAIAHEQISKGHSVLFGTVPSLLSRIRSTYNDSDNETEREVMQVFYRCSLLILDDLGKEKVGDWVEERLYEIVNDRYNRNLPIIITTNVGLESVQKLYKKNGAAIVSRLFEMCKGISIKGADYRMKKGNL